MLESWERTHFQTESVCVFCRSVRINIHTCCHCVRSDGCINLLPCCTQWNVRIYRKSLLCECRLCVVLLGKHEIEIIGKGCTITVISETEGFQSTVYDIVKFRCSNHNLPPYASRTNSIFGRSASTLAGMPALSA